MVVSTAINPKTTSQIPKRPPLLPSDPDNALAPRNPKSREVTSRYMSSTPSSSKPSTRRSASPLVSRTATSTAAMMTPVPSTIKRSLSVERKRPATPRPNSPDVRIGSGGELSNAQKMLLTSTRSLSVSFQGSSFSVQVSKAKPAPSPSPISSIRKWTPERRKGTVSATTPAKGRDLLENSQPVEQQRWPGRLRQVNLMSRSVDCTDERRRSDRSGANVVRALQNCMVDDRASYDRRLSSNPNCAEHDKPIELAIEANSRTGSDAHCDPAASDTESMSSGSTSGTHDSNNCIRNTVRGSRGVPVAARFLQENNISSRQLELVSPVFGLKSAGAQPKLIVPRKFSADSPLSSPKGVVNNKGSSPIRASMVRHALPSKFGTSTLSPSRGMSPTRARSAVAGIMSSNLNNTPSISGFAADFRKGKVGEDRIVEGHTFRIFYNRLLQWRFINARADTALLAQRVNAEKSLYNALVATWKLRESVRTKRNELLLLRQNLKLISILKGQMKYLEEWMVIDADYSSSLLGAIEALRASTLRLPVIGGARADVQNVKDAISSTVDVMQSMASSICLLLSKVGNVNSLVAELANTAAKERALLGQCKDLLSTIVVMQVKECSLRTHILQQKSLPSSPTTRV
ncbi:QWRF motif-containing protein 2 [Tripterygium wilfordii]|uniref:QWRF motif-containing protein 2 n=1 Tax=Tripterygium wilfordii TaxID=458696 RepID=A0A7J7CZB1_TRIWF|nr:QWRF motif-containing protein 2-like [Tripterygium wilfordii]KAF5739451.1 QWRF motif-containing protein 2 [Tripterygium wilfordii]